MVRRALILLALVSLLAFGGVAVAGKRKIQPGVYPGTTSNGIPMQVTLAKSRKAGTFTYCEAAGFPFVVSGRSFSVFVPDAEGNVHLSASGRFSKSRTAKSATVSGSIPLGGGCDGTPQTFKLKHK
jgi:hypothetical protein